MRNSQLQPFRRVQDAPPLIYGHRGARSRAPENTLTAFQLAVDEGAQGVELDVRHTADGQLVVFHDPHLADVEPGSAPRLLSQLTLAQLRALRGSVAPIPTLREVLDWQADTGALLNIELKPDVAHRSWMARRCVAEVQDTAARRGPLPPILYSSFDPRLVALIARRDQERAVAWLLHAGQRLAPEIQRRLPRAYRWLGAQAVHLQHTMATGEFIRRLQRSGAVVNCWTVNDPSEARRLTEWGIDGLITDDPKGLVTALGSQRSTQRDS